MITMPGILKGYCLDSSFFRWEGVAFETQMSLDRWGTNELIDFVVFRRQGPTSSWG
jgi:hypothetical protein